MIWAPPLARQVGAITRLPTQDLADEQFAVANALALEAQAKGYPVNDPNWNPKPRYAEAADAWMAARQAALKVHMATTGILSINAQTRADAYGWRRTVDASVASGETALPAADFQWPPIQQVTAPPGVAPPLGEPPLGEAGAGSALPFLLLALGLGYAGWTVLSRRVG